MGKNIFYSNETQIKIKVFIYVVLDTNFQTISINFSSSLSISS